VALRPFVLALLPQYFMLLVNATICREACAVYADMPFLRKDDQAKNDSSNTIFANLPG
jgi:hypothetical protein